MAKKIERVFAIEAYENEETNDPKTGDYTWKRPKRAKRLFLDADGDLTDNVEMVVFYTTEKIAKQVLKNVYGGPKDERFKVAEPVVVAFTRE